MHLYLPATVKLSVLLAVVLRHIKVVAALMNVLDTVTCRVEVKLAFRGVFIPLTLMRVPVNGPRFKITEGVELTVYLIPSLMSGLCHSRELDPNTRQVNVTRSPGHVNCLSLFEVSSTFSTIDRVEVNICASNECAWYTEYLCTAH